VPAPDNSFAQLMLHGFGDGTYPTYSDWTLHLSQVWPHVRIRETIELRVTDGLPWPHLSAAPAFWVGLAYDSQIRQEALDVLADYTLNDLQLVTDEVAVHGLGAQKVAPVRTIAGKLLTLAKRGLSERVAAGREPVEVLSYLAPLEDVMKTGRTFAERCLDRWLREFDRRPGRYVGAYQVR
jgi:glutamate--cysteine ligase